MLFSQAILLAEWEANAPLTGFAEYDYYGFTSQSANFNCVSGTVVCTIPAIGTTVGTIPINATQHINVFKVGLNVKFGGW
jgi:hypothetical protein